MSSRSQAGPRWAPAGVLAFALLVGVAAVGAGCRTAKPEPIAVARFHLETASELPPPWAIPVELPVSRTRFAIGRTPVLAETDIANVELVRVDLGLCLLFQFRPEGARTLQRLTAANLGRRLVLTINGVPVGARVIAGAVGDGNWLTFVEAEEADVERLALELRRAAEELDRRTRKAS